MSVQSFLSQDLNKNDSQRTGLTSIAIIGGGPKGMYGLERLVAQWQTMPEACHLNIHIFNRTQFFGAGDVYRPDLPKCVLMNVCNEEINIWMKDAKPPTPVQHPLSFLEWLSHHDISADRKGYSPRALVGRYLEDGFKAILNALPANVTVKTIVDQVIKLEKSDQGYQVITDKEQQNLENRLTYQSILLATGHPRKVLSVQEKFWLNQTRDDDATGYIPCIHPNTKTLDKIRPKSVVGIKGLGLTFMDTVLLLTEGRGGHFEEAGNKLIYQPSGNEPGCIFPFSRTGLPMQARADMTPSTLLNPPQFFTRQAIADLKQQKGHKIDFEQDLYPLLQREATLAFYKVLFKNHEFNVSQKVYERFQDLEEAIAKFHSKYPDIPRFDLKELLDPTQDQSFKTPDDYHRFICDFIKRGINEAKKGPKYSPYIAVSEIWRRISVVFGEIFRFGGLEPASQQIFMQKYWPQISRITYGPPLKNMKKLCALIASGIVKFNCGPNPEVTFDQVTHQFKVKTQWNTEDFHIHYLIDARIPKNSLDVLQNGLYADLLHNGDIRPYKNKSTTCSATYQPGCIELTTKGYAIDSQDKVNYALAATGTPTEGITFDNDALSPYRNNFVNAWSEDVKKRVLTNELLSSRTNKHHLSTIE